MRINVLIEEELDLDFGEDQTIFIRGGIETVEDMLHALQRVMHAAGFTYVESLSASSENHSWGTDL